MIDRLDNAKFKRMSINIQVEGRKVKVQKLNQSKMFH